MKNQEVRKKELYIKSSKDTKQQINLNLQLNLMYLGAVKGLFMLMMFVKRRKKQAYIMGYESSVYKSNDSTAYVNVTHNSYGPKKFRIGALIQMLTLKKKT